MKIHSLVPCFVQRRKKTHKEAALKTKSELPSRVSICGKFKSIQRCGVPQKTQSQLVDNQEIRTDGLYKGGDRANVLKWVTQVEITEKNGKGRIIGNQ